MFIVIKNLAFLTKPNTPKVVIKIVYYSTSVTETNDVLWILVRMLTKLTQQSNGIATNRPYMILVCSSQTLGFFGDRLRLLSSESGFPVVL